MKAWLIAGILLVSLAGCSDESETPEGGDHHGSDRVAEAPTWNLTDYWTFQHSDGESVTYAVAIDDGSDWQLLPTSLSTAQFDYETSISFVGTITKATLAGEQGSDSIDFFNFPLEHNKTWQTKWDGESRSLTAHAMDNGKWHIRAVTPGTGATFADYMYDESVKWFTEVNFYNQTDGSLQFELDLTASGTGFSSEVYRYTDISTAYLLGTNIAGAPQGTISVGEGVSELAIEMAIWCGSWAGPAGVGMQVPQEDGSAQAAPPLLSLANQGPETYGEFGNCPGINGDYDWLIDEPMEGTWRIDGIVGEGMDLVYFFVEERTYEAIIPGA